MSSALNSLTVKTLLPTSYQVESMEDMEAASEEKKDSLEKASGQIIWRKQLNNQEGLSFFFAVPKNVNLRIKTQPHGWSWCNSRYEYINCMSGFFEK